MAKRSVVSSRVQKHWKHKTPVSHKLSKELEDLKECSFSPNLSQTRSAYQTPNSVIPHFEKLYSKHKAKIIKLESRSRQKKENELVHCTFVPKVNNTYTNNIKYSKSASRERQNAYKGQSAKNSHK